MSEEKQQNLMIPIAIVIAGAIVGAAIFFVDKGQPTTAAATAPAAAAAPTTVLPKDVPAVTAADHITGNLGAPVTVVQYTDLECPFCKQFTGTMQQVMAAYPGKVAWVIRNFPLQQLHPNAPKLALAAECVSALGGNDDYWKFLASIIAQAPINTFFDMTKLDATATGVGVSGTAFDSCIASGKYEALITQEFNDATAAGGQGTPFSILVLSHPMSASVRQALTGIQTTNPGSITLSADGTQVGMNGSQPYAVVQSILNALLQS